VRRVVYAAADPNLGVAAGGAAVLAASGIEVAGGCCAAAARAMNRGFYKRFEFGRPHVCLKLAASLDGRTALQSGQSQWITGPEARADVQRLRARSSAVLSGVSTLQRDDSRLTVRDGASVLRGRKPLKVVLDPDLALSPSARVLDDDGPVLVLTGSLDETKASALAARGAEVHQMPGLDARDLPAVLAELARREVNELLVESGHRLAGAFVAAGLVDELVLYLAPSLLGPDAQPLVGLPLLADLQDRHRFGFSDVRQVGDDLRVVLVPVGDGGR
jgi:diaminohydroxyphosphoribosylaminopyrimidine deaminase/5-amino-6-(5-phosphoribosylamino)uracil reductase